MRRNTKAFTLIELLTVVFIISLLIGILLPSLNRARIQAKTSTVKALFSTIETGMEMFRNDFGQYPHSLASSMALSAPTGEFYGVVGGNITQSDIPCVDAQGAHLLADAMVGRDLLGYDPSTTIPNVRYRWHKDNPRTGPYVKPDAALTETVFTDIMDNDLGPILFPKTAAAGFQRDLRFLVDAFGSPILYYRANPNSRPNQDAHEIYGGYAPPFNMGSGWDNIYFTRDTITAGTQDYDDPKVHYKPDGSERHYLWQEKGYDKQEYDHPSFYDYIQDKKTSIATGWDPDATGQGGGVRRPYNPESYLLISTGPDQTWGLPPGGQTDDVTNFVRAR